ncbi:MAG: baseplate J/gp47 family protein [Roseburia sp.]|nr:baseplate J/gp47 family protein [Roseburia sp.]
MEMSKIEELPDISFIDDMTLEDVESLLMEKFREHYRENTGTEPVIEKSDPYRLWILTQAVLDYQMMLFIDKCGKMNFLKYAAGEYLDHMGAFKNRPRSGAKKAGVQVLFSLAETRDSVEIIPAGTMVTADKKVFFETTEYAEIPAGELSAVVFCECTTEGKTGNGYGAGEITTLATPTGFVSSVVNVTPSIGGRDEENDGEYREGIFEAPDQYSVAGADPAWVSVTKQYNPDVADVMPDTVPGSGVALITVVMKNGRLPGEEEMRDIQDHLMQPGIRPLTTKVQVQAPSVKEYDISLIYYIARSDKERAAEICTAAEDGVADYICWQGVHEPSVEIGSRNHDMTSGETEPAVGRDINPDELVMRLKKAGIKRVEITAPVFCPVASEEIAKFSGNLSVKYGGVEDD